jgi:phosphoserine phosphatase
MQSSIYKLAAFDMDGTLLSRRSIFVVAEKTGLIDQVMKIINNDIYNYEKTIEIAKLLKGMSKNKFTEIVKTIPFNDGVEEVIKELKRKEIKTAIISAGYDLATSVVKEKLGIDYAISNKLCVDENGILTGEVELYNKNIVKRKGDCKSYSVCKRDALRDLCKIFNISLSETIAVGDGHIDIYMLKEAGLSFAYDAPPEVREVADIQIDNIKEILKYV